MSTGFLVYSLLVAGALGAGIGICVYAAWPRRGRSHWRALKRHYEREVR